MDAPYSGGCICGALRYRLDGPPVEQTFCQCRDCQRRSGSGHASWLVFVADPAAAVTGPAAQWTAHGDGGTEKRHGFCPNCGAPVYLVFPAMPGIIAVTAASLDDPARFAPRQVTWTEAAQPWDVLAPGLTRHARMPPPP